MSESAKADRFYFRAAAASARAKSNTDTRKRSVRSRGDRTLQQEGVDDPSQRISSDTFFILSDPSEDGDDDADVTVKGTADNENKEEYVDDGNVSNTDNNEGNNNNERGDATEYTNSNDGDTSLFSESRDSSSNGEHLNAMQYQQTHDFHPFEEGDVQPLPSSPQANGRSGLDAGHALTLTPNSSTSGLTSTDNSASLVPGLPNYVFGLVVGIAGIAVLGLAVLGIVRRRRREEEALEAWMRQQEEQKQELRKRQQKASVRVVVERGELGDSALAGVRDGEGDLNKHNNANGACTKISSKNNTNSNGDDASSVSSIGMSVRSWIESTDLAQWE